MSFIFHSHFHLPPHPTPFFVRQRNSKKLHWTSNSTVDVLCRLFHITTGVGLGGPFHGISSAELWDWKWKSSQGLTYYQKKQKDTTQAAELHCCFGLTLCVCLCVCALWELSCWTWQIQMHMLMGALRWRVFPKCHWQCEKGKMSQLQMPLSTVGFRLIFLAACWEEEDGDYGKHTVAEKYSPGSPTFCIHCSVQLAEKCVFVQYANIQEIMFLKINIYLV